MLAKMRQWILRRHTKKRPPGKNMEKMTHVGGEVSLLILGGSLLLGLGRSSGLLLLLLGFLLTILLASLQLGLGDLLAGHLIEEEVGHGGLGLLNSMVISHGDGRGVIARSQSPWEQDDEKGKKGKWRDRSMTHKMVG